MTTKYRIEGGHPTAKIEEVDILRETEHCIFLRSDIRRYPTGERKELKKSEWHEYYDTWEDAHAALTAKAERRVANARRELEIANGFAGNVKGMRVAVPARSDIKTTE
jgi:hypothetical protein